MKIYMCMLGRRDVASWLYSSYDHQCVSHGFSSSILQQRGNRRMADEAVLLNPSFIHQMALPALAVFRTQYLEIVLS